VFQRVDGTSSELWKVAADGSKAVALGIDHAGQPAVSRDGNWIAFFESSDPAKPPQLALASIDGGQIRATFDVPRDVVQGRETAPELNWSPDGRNVTYIVQREGVGNLWAQPIDLGNLGARMSARQVTHFNSDLIFGFAWSVDGKQMSLARGRYATDVMLISHFY